MRPSLGTKTGWTTGHYARVGILIIVAVVVYEYWPRPEKLSWLPLLADGKHIVILTPRHHGPAVVMGSLITVDGCTNPVVASHRVTPTRDSQKFHGRRDHARNKFAECPEGHCAVDLSGMVGTPVVAMWDGVVKKVVKNDQTVPGSPRARAGHYIVLRHQLKMSDGFVHVVDSWYLHLKEKGPAEPKVGERVAAGSVIGHIGRTGVASSESHLHLYIYSEGGEHLDPEAICPAVRSPNWRPH